MTHAQKVHAVATALVSMHKDDEAGIDCPGTAEEVARRSNVHVGQVRKIMKHDFGLLFTIDGTFGWTTDQYDFIEAIASEPAPQPPAPPNNQVINIHNNHGQVIAGDNHGDFVVNVTHHLEQVLQAIEEAPLPEEQKAEAKSTLWSLARTLGLEAFNAGVAGATQGLVQGTF